MTQVVLSYPFDFLKFLGWIKTFEQYYQDQTSQILSGMAKHLGEKTDMRFIYAEISFFEMWWRQQTEETRKKVKGLVVL